MTSPRNLSSAICSSSLASRGAKDSVQSRGKGISSIYLSRYRALDVLLLMGNHGDAAQSSAGK